MCFLQGGFDQRGNLRIIDGIIQPVLLGCPLGIGAHFYVDNQGLRRTALLVVHANDSMHRHCVEKKRILIFHVLSCPLR